MALWPWIERKFNFDYPPTKFPDLLERLRGTPARLEARVAGLSRELLTRRPDQGWSIQQNVGHLIDLGFLPARRIEQILAGEAVLIAADMTNRATNEADHNAADMKQLLRTFRAERGRLVARLESLPQEAWGKSALHPRLQTPMRIVDIVCFDSEHDDYHLARIGALVRALSPGG
ncbi:MAG: DinB family protein [Planctomycetes bacterium]|nr:DinB family protein [Planctomycetota bacterium]